MTFRRFLLIDSLALDAAGIGALVTGATTLGIVLLVVAAVTFAVHLVTRRTTPVAA